ncbi:hypothetical protein FB107DRAFT_252651 [Schizophyllum commune]
MDDSINKLQVSYERMYAPAEDLVTLQDHFVELEDAQTRTSDTLRHDINCLSADLSALSARIEEQSKDMSDLCQIVRGVVDDGSSITPVPSASIVKSEPGTQSATGRENMYNTAMRHVFLVALGLPMNRTLSSINPECAPTSEIEGGAWVVRQDALGTASGGVPMRVLQPDWHKRWSDNSEWHNELVRFVRAKISEIQPLMNIEYMSSKTDADLLTKLAATFKTAKASWMLAETASPTAGPAPRPLTSTVTTAATLVVPPDVKANRAQCKARKALKRLGALREGYDVEIVTDWLWVVDGYHYMLSDESGDEGVAEDAIDPASDDDSKGRKAKASGKTHLWLCG